MYAWVVHSDRHFGHGGPGRHERESQTSVIAEPTDCAQVVGTSHAIHEQFNGKKVTAGFQQEEGDAMATAKQSPQIAEPGQEFIEP